MALAYKSYIKIPKSCLIYPYEISHRSQPVLVDPSRLSPRYVSSHLHILQRSCNYRQHRYRTWSLLRFGVNIIELNAVLFREIDGLLAVSFSSSDSFSDNGLLLRFQIDTVEWTCHYEHSRRQACQKPDRGAGSPLPSGILCHLEHQIQQASTPRYQRPQNLPLAQHHYHQQCPFPSGLSSSMYEQYDLGPAVVVAVSSTGPWDECAQFQIL